MGLVSLVYVSFASHNMSTEELQEILTKARTFNPTKNITGMLLYRDRFFIQALEGEESDIDELYARIATDLRHEHVVTVFKEPIKTRSFGEWSMGFNNIDGVDPEAIPAFTAFLQKPTTEFLAANPSRARDMLMAFRAQESY